MEVLGEQTSWVWSRAQALRCMTAAQVATQLRRGAWQQPWAGVYADAGGHLDAVQRAVAAVLASGGGDQPAARRPGGPQGLRAVACGRTAARVHGFVLIDDDDPATGARQHLQDEVAVPSRRSPLTATTADGSPRLLHRRELSLRRGDVVVHGGLHLTSRLRTVADCAALLDPVALTCLLDDALRRGLVTASGLAELVASRAWCAGAVALRQAVAAADPRAESPAETVSRLLLLPVLPGLVPQVRVHDRGRVVARFDLGDERLRLAVEADGRRGHAGELMVAKDRRRDRTTGRLGWLTERFTWYSLRRRQDEVVATALEAAAVQARRHGLDRDRASR